MNISQELSTIKDNLAMGLARITHSSSNEIENAFAQYSIESLVPNCDITELHEDEKTRLMPELNALFSRMTSHLNNKEKMQQAANAGKLSDYVRLMNDCLVGIVKLQNKCLPQGQPLIQLPQDEKLVILAPNTYHSSSPSPSINFWNVSSCSYRHYGYGCSSGWFETYYTARAVSSLAHVAMRGSMHGGGSVFRHHGGGSHGLFSSSSSSGGGSSSSCGKGAEVIVFIALALAILAAIAAATVTVGMVIAYTLKKLWKSVTNLCNGKKIMSSLLRIGAVVGGAALGALKGMIVGAAIGTALFPGYGTAAGAILGLIGGIIGGTFTACAFMLLTKWAGQLASKISVKMGFYKDAKIVSDTNPEKYLSSNASVQAQMIAIHARKNDQDTLSWAYWSKHVPGTEACAINEADNQELQALRKTEANNNSSELPSINRNSPSFSHERAHL